MLAYDEFAWAHWEMGAWGPACMLGSCLSAFSKCKAAEHSKVRLLRYAPLSNLAVVMLWCSQYLAADTAPNREYCNKGRASLAVHACLSRIRKGWVTAGACSMLLVSSETTIDYIIIVVVYFNFIVEVS